MRPARRRRQGARDRMAAGIARRDQAAFQRDDLRHRLGRGEGGEFTRRRLRILPGLGSAQRIDHAHRLLGIERGAGAPQRHRLLPPGACEVRLAGIIRHPGGLQRRLGRGVQRARLLQHMAPGEEAARERRVRGVLDQRAERRGGDRGGRGRMRAGDGRRGIAAMRALLQPARHGRAHRFARAQVEIRRLFGRRRPEGRLAAFAPADTAGGLPGSTGTRRCGGRLGHGDPT